MEAKKRIPLWKVALANSIAGTLAPDWARGVRVQLREQVAEDKIKKLEKKLTNSTSEEKSKIEKEILLFKARKWWGSKSFKEQWAMEKEAKRQKIKLDDYLIEEYVKTIKSQK